MKLNSHVHIQFIHGRIHVHYLVYLQTEIALGTVRLFKAVSFTLSIREIPDIKTVKHLVDQWSSRESRETTSTTDSNLSATELISRPDVMLTPHDDNVQDMSSRIVRQKSNWGTDRDKSNFVKCKELSEYVWAQPVEAHR